MAGGNTGHIEIIIGARRDASMGVIFNQIPKDAERARAALDKALNRPGGAGLKAAQAENAKAANNMLAEQTRAAAAVAKMKAASEKKSTAERLANEKHAAAEELKIRRAVAAEEAKLARTQQKQHDYWKRARDSSEMKRSRDAARQQAKQERESSQQQDRLQRSFAYRTAYHGLIRYAPSAINRGARVANDIIRGAGVDLNLGSSVGRSVSLDSQALTLANNERIATGKTRGGKYYSDMARQTAKDTFSDSDSVMKLQARFAARTGNYSQLGEITPQLARMARASGADFDQVGMAAGAVFQQFEGDPEGMKKTLEVMRSVIGQSAEGAVDMPDYAKQLGRVAAGAFKFEGDRGTNVSKLSALTQIAMERGATSAADAARSTGSFVSTLGKGARLAQFDKAGVRIYTDDTLGKDGKVVAGKNRNTMRDPFEIIKDAFRTTKGNIPQLGKMFMDVLGRKGVESLGAIYTGAGGGEKGIEAVQGQFDRYMRATMTADVEKQNMRDVANSPEAKAKLFQENLDKIVSEMAGKILPALSEMAPNALKIAKIMGDAAIWVSGNIGAAIATAIGLSLARAGLESVLRLGLENLLTRAASRLGQVGRGGAAAVGELAGGTGAIVPGGKGVVKGAAPTGANMLGAGVIGLTIGSIFAEQILTQGISSYDKNTKNLNAASQKLVGAENKGPAALSMAIVEAKETLRKAKDEEPMWAKAMGVNDADFKGFEKLISKEEARLNTGGVYSGGVKGIAKEVKSIGPTPVTFDESKMAGAVGTALRSGEIAARITNLPAGTGSALEPPRVDPRGRAAAP